MQQHLPFTVLKPKSSTKPAIRPLSRCNSTYRLRYWNTKNIKPSVSKSDPVATALTVYGIETSHWWPFSLDFLVATALTVYGIETVCDFVISCVSQECCNSTYRLRYWNVKILAKGAIICLPLQQHLPFTVLKHDQSFVQDLTHFYIVATALTVYGIETRYLVNAVNHAFPSCNSTYRLRYWNCSCLIRNVCFEKLEQYLPFIVY